MEVDGQPILDLLEAMGVVRSATRRVVIEIDGPGTVTVREFLCNEQGKIYRDRGRPAEHEVVATVRWPN